MSPVGRRPYQHVPNNYALSGAHFTAQLLNAAAINNLHYSDCRLRHAVHALGLRTPSTGVPTGGAGFAADLAPHQPFDGCGTENRLRVRCIWAVAARAGYANARVRWYTQTEDQAGGNVSAFVRYETQLLEVRQGQPGSRLDVPRLDWPRPQGQGEILVYGPWVDHTPNAALPLSGRVLRIIGYMDQLDAGAAACYLWGVVAYAFRNGL